MGQGIAGEGGWPQHYHLRNPLYCHQQLSDWDIQGLWITLCTFKTNQNCQEPWGLAYCIQHIPAHYAVHLPHRESELIWYGEYVTTYFVSTDAGGQNHIINLDKAICHWSGSINNVSLDQFKKLRFLKVWHFFSKAAGDQNAQGNQWGVSVWWRTHAGCSIKESAGSRCLSVGTDIGCRKEGHAEKECTSKKAWAVMCVLWGAK